MAPIRADRSKLRITPLINGAGFAEEYTHAGRAPASRFGRLGGCAGSAGELGPYITQLYNPAHPPSMAILWCGSNDLVISWWKGLHSGRETRMGRPRDYRGICHRRPACPKIKTEPAKLPREPRICLSKLGAKLIVQQQRGKAGTWAVTYSWLRSKGEVTVQNEGCCCPLNYGSLC